MAYMVAAYLIIWMASFVFILTMVQRQRALKRDIETLKEMASEAKAPAREPAEIGSPATVR